MEFQKLTVKHYAENATDERRITLSPANIIVVAAAMEDIVLGGRSLRPVQVLFAQGESIDLLINHADLELLEAATGSFCLD
jgi:Mg2+/citrate symporter